MKPTKVSLKNLYNVVTSRDRVDELWALLRYETLMSPQIDNKLKQLGLNQVKRNILKTELLSYLDQAQNFYTYAKSSDYRSAALLYYYSFMNLAKAAIVINKPQMVGANFAHGLGRKNKTGELKDRSIVVKGTTNGYASVFNELYMLEYGNKLPDKKVISFEHLLPYITDQNYERQQVVPGTPDKVHNVKAYVFTDDNRKKAWSVLATQHGFYPNNFKKSYKNFELNFERFNLQSITRELTLKMSPDDAMQYTFSQSKVEFDYIAGRGMPEYEVNNHIKTVLRNYIQDEIFDESISFAIVDPLRNNLQLPMNEHIASYAIMYYLSEIVRYKPVEFGKMLLPTQKEGWMIKNFIESTPYIVLVNLAADITGNKYLIHER